MSEQNMTPRLREGIDAAKRGDKATARRLLQQVLGSDGDNELALMWMASVVEPLDERRFFLERALRVNPNNTRASEALKRLGGSEPVNTTPRLRTSATNRTDARRAAPAPNSNLFLIAAAVVAFVVIAVIVASAVSSLSPQQVPTPTIIAVQVLEQTRAALLVQSQTPTRVRVQPTPTVLAGIVVTLDTALLTPLPPTFTPTPTPEPSETPQPTETPLPLSRFEIIYADFEPDVPEASLYQSRGDGSSEEKLASGSEGGFDNLAYDPTSGRIAFTRGVSSGGDPVPQVFVAPLSNPAEAEQVTQMTGTSVSHLSWSPDGTTLVFSANNNGNDEIWVLDLASAGLRQMTDSPEASDTEPSYSPDGTQILFTSDADSPGFSRIYVMTTNAENVSALTESPISKSAAWSPDGTRIAYINNQQGDDDVYVMDANGQRAFLISVDDSGAADSFPVWSPDGLWLFFASNRGGDTGWYVTDLQGNVDSVTVPGRTPQSLSFVTD